MLFDDLGLDQKFLEDDDFRYALGTGGTTRKKLARAAHCILEVSASLSFYFVKTLGPFTNPVFFNKVRGQHCNHGRHCRGEVCLVFLCVSFFYIKLKFPPVCLQKTSDRVHGMVGLYIYLPLAPRKRHSEMHWRFNFSFCL